MSTEQFENSVRSASSLDHAAASGQLRFTESPGSVPQLVTLQRPETPDGLAELLRSRGGLNVTLVDSALNGSRPFSDLHIMVVNGQLTTVKHLGSDDMEYRREALLQERDNLLRACGLTPRLIFSVSDQYGVCAVGREFVDGVGLPTAIKREQISREEAVEVLASFIAIANSRGIWFWDPDAGNFFFLPERDRGNQLVFLEGQGITFDDKVPPGQSRNHNCFTPREIAERALRDLSLDPDAVA